MAIFYVVLSIFQRYKMKANHNFSSASISLTKGAFNISKIQDESKSQRSAMQPLSKDRCFQYFKDTRWKQITTIASFFIVSSLVLSIFQRYKMKANHNVVNFRAAFIMVLSIFQRYKMKANHNTIELIPVHLKGAFNISKIQDESKSQQSRIHAYILFRCFQYFKDTRWKQITTRLLMDIWQYVVLSIFQRYKMKANHNYIPRCTLLLIGAFNISKIQDESKSQLGIDDLVLTARCFQYFKDTRWKQITTPLHSLC